jgi:hypothetical protein
LIDSYSFSFALIEEVNVSLQTHEKTKLPRTKNENPLTRGKETGKTGEKPIYLEGDRERPEETGRGASGKFR